MTTKTPIRQRCSQCRVMVAAGQLELLAPEEVKTP